MGALTTPIRGKELPTFHGEFANTLYVQTQSLAYSSTTQASYMYGRSTSKDFQTWTFLHNHKAAIQILYILT